MQQDLIVLKRRINIVGKLILRRKNVFFIMCFNTVIMLSVIKRFCARKYAIILSKSYIYINLGIQTSDWRKKYSSTMTQRISLINYCNNAAFFDSFKQDYID